MQRLIDRAKELLADGTVVRVLGWKAGDMDFNPEPAMFDTAEELKNFVYDGFCGANLSKFMIEASKLEGKTLVFLKPCDTYSFNQLIKEHRVDRDKAYIIGVGCQGKLSVEKIKATGIKAIESISGADAFDAAEELTVQTLYGEKKVAYKDAMLQRCHVCKGKEHMIYDELLGDSKDTKDADRFAEVERIEAMSPEERFAFFQAELSKCIRCNACRNVCPACSCRKCSAGSPGPLDTSTPSNPPPRISSAETAAGSAVTAQPRLHRLEITDFLTPQSITATRQTSSPSAAKASASLRVTASTCPVMV